MSAPRALTDSDAAEIRRRYWWGRDSFSSLAREMGVDPATVRSAAFSQGAYAERKATK